jgi:uncharacterized protein YlxW (UPF0749 family)
MATLEVLEKNIEETTNLYGYYVNLVKTKIKALEEQLKVFTAHKDTIASSQQLLEAKVAELEGNVATASQAQTTALEEAAALKSELAALTTSSGIKDADLTSTKDALKEANKKVEEANKKALAKDAELLKMTGDLRKVNDELTRLQNEKADIDEKINAVNEQLEALKKRIQDESASLSGTVGTVVEPEVTGQGTEGPEVTKILSSQEKSKQGFSSIGESQINEYKTKVNKKLTGQDKISFDNLKTKILNRIKVLNEKGPSTLEGKEADEYQQLQALKIPVPVEPETEHERTQGGKTRKRTMSGKKSKTQKRTKNGKNGRKNGGKRSKTQKRTKNGTKNGGKKSNRKTRK